MTSLPATDDLAWTALGVLAVGLLVAALVVWSRSTDRSIVALAWFFGMLVLPILGPVGYLVDTRRRRRLAQATD
ncbi:PLDc N-terminal domain-containing protein [Serinibacter arcticus]|uniref:PLDc N-terminal domain-containing protein n=1 Tax=Serinibacter arcticus TaxID=1655435 RepID=UPI001F371183|nr:PLDc N-terminal domain-containing protein [Serinibacter arcticus]